MSVSEITATHEPAPLDKRPPCPTGFPECYVITWWEWRYNEWGRAWRWENRVSMFPHVNHRSAIDEVAKLQAQGHRVVSIVTIPAVQ